MSPLDLAWVIVCCAVIGLGGLFFGGLILWERRKS